jgi:hypothetical protein
VGEQSAAPGAQRRELGTRSTGAAKNSLHRDDLPRERAGTSGTRLAPAFGAEGVTSGGMRLPELEWFRPRDGANSNRRSLDLARHEEFAVERREPNIEVGDAPAMK